MQFNITWDASVGSAPAAFKQTAVSVAQFFASQFTDAVTVNVAVGYGEVGGSALPSGALGASLTYFQQTSYTALSNALKQDASTAVDIPGAASLPAVDPTSNGHFWLTTANAKALGLGSNAGLDGYVGFSKTVGLDYDTSDGVSPGQYDFYSVVAHEFSEIMGRQLLTGEKLGGQKSYEPLDLFHYSAPGVRNLTGTSSGYFSTDGGAHNVRSFNTLSPGDFGDWASGAGPDAFNAFGQPGVANTISSADLTALDVIGWNKGSSSTTTMVSSAGANTIISSASHEVADLGPALLGHMGRVHLVSDLDYFNA